ncbi:hypothetical protein [Catellatospora vulcania]|uniref:hypothetical protein n=1 Tax=Catellatospora vulcania TaxID=1460450 RepID=UPI0012D3AFCE|nr:hypothetical protein [Catellatospora vulcania]
MTPERQQPTPAAVRRGRGLRTTAGAVVTAAAVAALLAAGAARGGGVAPPPTPGAPLTHEERAELSYAEQILIARCMTAAGFDYQALPVASGEQRDFPYVVDDPGWARRHGYGADLRAAAEQARQAHPHQAYLTSLTEAQRRRYQEVYQGTGQRQLSVQVPGGPRITMDSVSCLATARTALYGDLATWFGASTIAENLRPLVVPAVTADVRYRRALAGWSACVHEHGYVADTPAQLRADTGAPERARAAVEADCAVRTGLGVLARAVHEEHLAAVSREHGDPVRHLRDIQRAALPMARDLITREKEAPCAHCAPR